MLDVSLKEKAGVQQDLNRLKYNGKELRNMKKKDLHSLDCDTKAEMDVVKLKEKKPLMFGENKMLAISLMEKAGEEQDLDRLKYNGKELRNLKKQDLDRLYHNAKAKMDVVKLKEKKPLMLGENKMMAVSLKEKAGKEQYLDRLKYNGKELRNMKKQDLDRLDHNAKAKMDVVKLTEKKPLMFGENKILASSATTSMC